MAGITWKLAGGACKERFGATLSVSSCASGICRGLSHTGTAFGRGWGARMDDKPSRDQFSIGPYQVQHIPTGAKFGAYPGRNDICYIIWGRMADDRDYVAQDYCAELTRIAGELLRERAKY